MTYCVAMRLDAGLVFLADSRTNAGVDQISTFRKMTVFEHPGECLLVLGAVATWLAIVDRARVLRLVLGALPLGVVLVAYGWHTFGDPWAAGQLLVGPRVAITKTGNPDLWQTPFFVGAAGLLFSPARGLLVYSPIVAVALWGMGRVWRDGKWADWRPLTLAALALFLPAAKRFDWWGGWCYGYRLIMDAVTLLAFLAIPMVAWVRVKRWRQIAVSVLALWSFGVQVLGVTAYDIGGWDARLVFDVLDHEDNRRATYDDRSLAEQHAQVHGGRVQSRSLNIDRPEYRHRLWSLTDTPIRYYLQNWSRARSQRQKNVIRFMHQDG